MSPTSDSTPLIDGLLTKVTDNDPEETKEWHESLDALIADIQKVRSAGIAYEIEESTAEICCAAVPLAEDGVVKAAISVTLPKFRYTDEKKQQITRLLLQKRQLIEDRCRIQNCRLSF